MTFHKNHHQPLNGNKNFLIVSVDEK